MTIHYGDPVREAAAYIPPQVLDDPRTILRELLNRCDCLIVGGSDDEPSFLLIAAPPSLVERLALFEADTVDDEEDDPAEDGEVWEDDDPAGGAADDEGEPQADDLHVGGVTCQDPDRAYGPSAWPSRPNGFVWLEGGAGRGGAA